MSLKNCGRFNVTKHRDIKGSDKYVTLEIPLKFRIMDILIITSSEPKYILGGSGKGLITSLGIKTKTLTVLSEIGKHC